MSFALRATYAGIMLFAVFIVVGGTFPSIGRRFLFQEKVTPAYALGDLYCMSGLDRFRETIPAGRQAPMPALESADILTLGDSFFNSNLASDLFAIELSAKLALKVHNLQSPTFTGFDNYPVPFLESIGYKPGRKRIMILETVERAIFTRAANYRLAAGPQNSKRQDSRAAMGVEYFFKNNLIVYPLAKLLGTAKFKLLNVTDKSIGAYSLNPDMLFFRDEVRFSKRKKTDEMLDSTAASIADLSEKLKRRYDVDLIYLVIPDKYSVYRGLDKGGDSYDGFIPRLSKKLTERGVKNVDLYTVFSSRNKPGMPLLYYASDTHYTAAGKALAVEACAEMISSLGKDEAGRP